MSTIVLNPFTIDRDEHSLNHVLCCEDKSLTVQSDVQQSDINFIVKQFGLTHELPYGLQVPRYEDFSNVPNDYHAAMNFVLEADSAFMEFPAEIRSRFNNDPGSFLDFVSNADNRDEAVKLGISIRPPAEPAPLPVPPAPEPSTKPIGDNASGGS